MDENHTMALSVMQYLESVKSQLKDNHATKPDHAKVNLYSIDLDDEPKDPIDYIQFGDELPNEYNPTPSSFKDENAMIFDQKMSINDDNILPPKEVS